VRESLSLFLFILDSYDKNVISIQLTTIRKKEPFPYSFHLIVQLKKKQEMHNGKNYRY